jgi:hypothetical protein
MFRIPGQKGDAEQRLATMEVALASHLDVVTLDVRPRR